MRAAARSLTHTPLRWMASASRCVSLTHLYFSLLRRLRLASAPVSALHVPRVNAHNSHHVFGWPCHQQVAGLHVLSTRLQHVIIIPTLKVMSLAPPHAWAAASHQLSSESRCRFPGHPSSASSESSSAPSDRPWTAGKLHSRYGQGALGRPRRMLQIELELVVRWSAVSYLVTGISQA